MTKEYRYFQFPLCLIGGTYKDPVKGLNRIIGYGTMNYALKLKYDLQRVAMQTIYDYGRKPGKLQPYLTECLANAIDEGTILYEKEYNGFDAKAKFKPDQDLCLDPLLEMFEKDLKLRDEAILNYRFHLASSKDHLNFEIKTNTTIINYYAEASEIKSDFEQRYGPDAMPCCKSDMVFTFRDEQINDIDLFRSYIGISSMIGRRNFISTNKPAILSRMIGCKNKAAFEHHSRDPFIRPTVDLYSKRYPMDKLLHTLRDREFIMYLSPGNRRSFYISKYMAPEDLAKLIKQSQSRYGMRQRIKQVTAAL